MIVFGIMAGGAAGALARYVVDTLATSRYGHAFPWGILLINATGSALLGFLTGLGLHHGFPKTPEAILGTGFCGGYTTFSTFAVDTVELAEAGTPGLAVRSVFANILLATVAAAAGLALAAL